MKEYTVLFFGGGDGVTLGGTQLFFLIFLLLSSHFFSPLLLIVPPPTPHTQRYSCSAVGKTLYMEKKSIFLSEKRKTDQKPPWEHFSREGGRGGRRGRGVSFLSYLCRTWRHKAANYHHQKPRKMGTFCSPPPKKMESEPQPAKRRD